MPAIKISSSSCETDVNSSWIKRQKYKLKIDLDEEETGAMKTYTTGDLIEGTAIIMFHCDTRYDDIEIVLEGISNTTLERTPYPGQTGCRKTLLALRYPLQYPQIKVFEAGRSYQFPFTFVFPGRLLTHVCHHSMKNTLVHQHHVLPPPTLGDSSLLGTFKDLRDDMTPEMCQILYQLSVTVIQRPSSVGPGFQLATKSNIKVIPSMDYYPIPEEMDAPRYIMQLGKDVKRGLLNGKSGRLALSSTIPNPIQLDLHQFTAANDLSTTATVSLRFDPESHQLPPQLERMNTKLRAHTFFATVPWSDFPHLSDERKYPRHEFGEYTESMRLSTRSIPSVQWEQCSASDSTSKNTSYTASIIVPITLPKSKAFAPTFHSCLVSRIYSLDITLSYCTSTSTILPTTLLLRVPLLISCQPRVEYLEMLPKSPILQLDLDEPHDSTGDTPPEYA